MLVLFVLLRLNTPTGENNESNTVLSVSLHVVHSSEKMFPSRVDVTVVLNMPSTR